MTKSGADPLPATVRTGRQHFAAYWRSLGPGIVAGASDNDPTTVGTLAVIGASTGYQLSWLVILLLPMLATIQTISAEVGVVTQQGLQALVRRRHHWVWSLVVLGAILAVNMITIGADLEAGGASLGLLIPVSWRLLLIPYTAVLLAVLLFGSYSIIERLLKFTLLLFGCYIVAAFAARPEWAAVLQATLQPRVHLSPTYIEGTLSLLGTTLTSYVYVWQMAAEAKAHRSIADLWPARIDAGLGMVCAVTIFWFILISTGATLGMHHTAVQTAQDAANALGPLLGRRSELVFAMGLLASSALAVPVLAATSAHVVADHFDWRHRLTRDREARLYSTVLTASVLVALAVAFAGVAPIRLLFLAGVAGGLATPITLIFLLLAARDRSVMGERIIAVPLALAGWLTTATVTGAGLLFTYVTVLHH